MSGLSEMIPIIEEAIVEAFASCDDVAESGALWAALSRTVDNCAVERIKSHGCDPDVVRETLDRYFLTNL